MTDTTKLRTLDDGREEWAVKVGRRWVYIVGDKRDIQTMIHAVEFAVKWCDRSEVRHEEVTR